VTWAQAYPTVHRSLAAEYRSLPAEQVDRLLVGVLGPGTGLEYTESFLDDVGHALGQVGKVVVKALPGAVSGAIAGAPAGLPGIIGGALLGGAGSVLGGGAAPAPQPAAPAVAPSAPAATAVVSPGSHPVTATASPAAAPAASPAATTSPTAPAAAAAPAAAGAGPQAALVQLLTALSSPTVRDAITAMLLGGAGARTVPAAGGTELPAAAVTNMLGVLSTQVSAGWDEIAPYRGTDHVALTRGAEGIDTASPDVRAAWIFQQLAPPEEPERGGDDDVDRQDDLDDEFEAQLWALGEAEDDTDEPARRGRYPGGWRGPGNDADWSDDPNGRLGVPAGYRNDDERWLR
jgi:hypothetical protein